MEKYLNLEGLTKFKEELEKLRLADKLELTDALNDLSGDIGNGTFTVKRNNVTVGSFSANQKTNDNINIVVPTSISDLGQTAITEILNLINYGLLDVSDLTEELKEALHESILDNSDFVDETSLSTELADYGKIINYDSSTKMIQLKNGDTVLSLFSAQDFLVDGMLEDVRITNGTGDNIGKSVLLIDFNTESGITDIEIPLEDIFDASNYYTKNEIDNAVDEKIAAAITAETLRATAAENALSSNKADKSTTLAGYGITDAYTKTEVNGLVNAPDEEDLTSVNVGGTDVLKFKDKAYNPLTYSGMGRKILRKNIVDGVNTLTQSMMTQTNTIYVIQYDFDLGSTQANPVAVAIPANCVLEFDGGSLSNGTIVGNYTTIKASPIKIFGANMLFSGTWNIGATFVEWFDTGNQADDFEKANSLGTTHLLIGKFYIFDRQVSVSNSVIGDGRIPSIIYGGAIANNVTSTIIYIGNGGETSVTPPAEAGDSILLIHDKNGIEILNINFVTSTEANINVQNLSVTSVFLDNPKFSAIKMTTEGASLRGNIISSCRFEKLPIGVNIYDLSMGTIYRYEVNSDNNSIGNCCFSNCGIGIQIYNTNAYNTIINKCYFYGGSNTYRHINMLKGTFVSIEGYFGPLSSTIEGIKAAVYVDNSHYYTMITPYAECHYGYFIYDNSNVGLADECNKALLNPVIKASEKEAPTIDGYKLCLYLGGSDNNIINIYGGTFTLSAYVNQGVLNLFGTSILKKIYNNSSNNAKVNKSCCPTGNTQMYNGQIDAVTQTSILNVGGASGTSNCTQLIYDDKNKKMRLGIPGMGYISATYDNIEGSWLDVGPFGIYLEPRTIDSEKRPRTIGGFVRNSDINDNHFSLGVFDAWKKLRDVFGNLVGTKYEGSTAQRPTGVHYGTSYFDTDLGKPIWWLVNETYPNGTWVDATGTPV